MELGTQSKQSDNMHFCRRKFTKISFMELGKKICISANSPGLQLTFRVSKLSPFLSSLLFCRYFLRKTTSGVRLRFYIFIDWKVVEHFIKSSLQWSSWNGNNIRYVWLIICNHLKASHKSKYIAIIKISSFLLVFILFVIFPVFTGRNENLPVFTLLLVKFHNRNVYHSRTFLDWMESSEKVSKYSKSNHHAKLILQIH